MELKGIIFDVDGTIADTEEFHRLAFNKAFDDFDLEWHWSEADYHDILSISGGKERFRVCLEKDKALQARIENPQTFISDLHRCKSEHYRTMLASGAIGLRPGVERLINEAREAGILLGIATSSSKNNFTTLIEQTLGVDPRDIFFSIVTSDIVIDKKPCPVVYQCALAGMGLTPEECIAIEDTANGNAAARNAGLQTVVTTHAYTTDNNFDGASLVVNHLGDEGNPHTVSQGNALGKELVDVELLRHFVAENQSMHDIEPFEEPQRVAIKNG